MPMAPIGTRNKTESPTYVYEDMHVCMHWRRYDCMLVS